MQIRRGIEMVKLARRPKRQVESADTDRLERKRKSCKAFVAETFAPEKDCYACDNSDHHLGSRANPVVVESQLQEIRKPDQHGHDADAIQPLSTDAGFQGSIEAGTS